MTVAAELKKKKKPSPRFFWCKVRRVIDPETGEEMTALCPAHRVDLDEMHARKLSPGKIVRVDAKERRNPLFYRLTHAFARLVAEGVDGFETEVESRDWHGVLKKLQRASGVACDKLELPLPGYGTIQINDPQSLSFEGMDEGEFQLIFRGLSGYVCRTYWPTMTPEAIEQQARMLEGGSRDGRMP